MGRRTHPQAMGDRPDEGGPGGNDASENDNTGNRKPSQLGFVQPSVKRPRNNDGSSSEEDDDDDDAALFAGGDINTPAAAPGVSREPS